MNAAFIEAVRPVAERMGWTLVHSTWEGAAVAAGLWVALVGMRRASAGWRYVVSCAAMVAVVLAMGVTFVMLGGTGRADVMARGGEAGELVDLRVRRMERVPVAVGRVVEVRPVEVRERIVPWLPMVAGVWAAGVVGLAVWHFGGWVRVRRMTRARVVDEWGERVVRLAGRVGVRRVVRVVESAAAGVPAVVGVLRPVILLPVGLAAELSVGQVEAILAHELAHVRRHDYLANLVQTAVETLLFYHPAVWWVSGQIRQEREHCCDDLAVGALGDRAGYAGALARVEEWRGGGRTRLAVGADGGSLLRRVRRIVGAEQGGSRATPLAMLVVAGVCVVGVVWGMQRPVRAAVPVAATRPATTRAVGELDYLKVAEIRPEDLVADIKDYRILANDLIAVEIVGGGGPWVEPEQSRRVNAMGKVALPHIGDVAVGGLTEEEAAGVIAKAYQDENQIAQAKFSVRLAEARGHTFSLWGDGAKHGGQYPIYKQDLRLFEALAVSGLEGAAASIHVIRGKGEAQRQIVIDVKDLSAGSKAGDLIVRPGDTLLALKAEAAWGRATTRAGGGDDVKVMGIRPEDLVAEVGDYRISRDDLLDVRISDVEGSSGLTTTSRRVDLEGKIGLPRLGRVAVVGLTCDEAERAIAKAYEDQHVMKRAHVMVGVAEARGAVFSVAGSGVTNPGQYPLYRPDTRLPEALARGGVTAAASVVHLIRGKGDAEHQILVEMKDLVPGGKADKLVVRSGDMLMVEESARRTVQVVVGRDNVLFDGKAIDVDGVGAAIRAIPAGDRVNTVLAVSAATGDVPVGRFMEVFGACVNKAQELGMPAVSNAGVVQGVKKAATSRAAVMVPKGVGEYYLGGLVQRPGIFSLGGRTILLSQAIISGGMMKEGGKYVTVLRREGDRLVRVVENAAVEDLFAHRIENLPLEPYDTITVTAERVGPLGPQAEIRPNPEAGGIGEAYVLGHVSRPGVYSVSGRKITVSQLVLSAGKEPQASDLVEVRHRDGPGRESLTRLSLEKVAEGTEPDLYLMPNDEINVGVAVAGAEKK